MYKLFPILLFAYGLAVTTEDIYDNSYALIIGIDKYKNKSLDYAVKDAESVEKLLENKFNFPQTNIKTLLNDEATLSNIKNSLSNIASTAKENDRVLIYFAGHGVTDILPDGGEMGYLLPIDGKVDNLFATSIPMDDIKRISSMSKSKHMLFLIDACYGGLSAVGARGLDAKTTPNYIDKITQDKARQIITAGGRGEEVIEKSEWGHSAFTMNLIRGLEDGKADFNDDGYITANELGLFLKEKVTVDSENMQTPQSRRFTSHEGEFVFITNIFIENQNIDKDNIIISEISYDSLANILVQKFEKNMSPVSKQSHIKKILPHITLSPQLTKLWGNDMLDKYGESRWSFSGGWNYWYYFSDNFALSIGIWFEKKRGLSRISDTNGMIGIVTEYDYDYITLPILVKKYIFKNKRYFTEVGIFYGHLSKTTAQSGGEDLTHSFQDWKNNDYGVIYGIGNDLMINENIIISIILRRQLGLQNISSINVYNNQTIQHSSVGFVFCIGLPKL